MLLYPESLFLSSDALRSEKNVDILLARYGIPDRCLFFSVPGYADGLISLQWIDHNEKTTQVLCRAFLEACELKAQRQWQGF
jgi:hypothetical protein